MGLGGFDIGDRRRQALPEAQQVVDAVGGELPVLEDRKNPTGLTPETSFPSRGRQTALTCRLVTVKLAMRRITSG